MSDKVRGPLSEFEIEWFGEGDTERKDLMDEAIRLNDALSALDAAMGRD